LLCDFCNQARSKGTTNLQNLASCVQADKDTPYGSLARAIRWLLLHYFDMKIIRNQRRIGEALMIASGIGLAIGGFSLGVMSIVYGGLTIVGLTRNIFSILGLVIFDILL
jgi:hypothetical protein